MSLKVLYVLPPTKTFAGIERVVDELCDHMAASLGHRIDVDVLFTSKYPGHSIENRRYNKIQREVKTRTQLMRTFREVAGDPIYDLVVVPQVEATVLTWVACLGRRKSVIVYLHGNPKVEARSWKARLLFKLMDKIVLARLAGVFGVSKSQLKAFQIQFPSKTPHFWVPNPVRRFPEPDSSASAVEPAAGGRDRTVRFVNVGRFSFQKGQDILLRAFAKAYRTRKSIRLALVGYGHDHDSIVDLITSLGLNEVVEIVHQPDNPQSALVSSDVYVSVSRWEGWSLAICEALRVGLPVIATDCEFGPSDILVDRRLGLLVPVNDEDRIAEAIVDFHDNLEREKQDAAFRMNYINAFDVEKIVHDHAAALEAVCPPQSRGSTRKARQAAAATP